MHRRCEPELMDDPGLEAQAHDHALRSLNRANSLLGVNGRLFREISRFGLAGRLSLLDLGSGGGGFLAYVKRRWRGTGANCLLGLDRSPHALASARSWSPADILFVAGDARSIPFRDRCVDIVTCSLFLHHFEVRDAVEILREAARLARQGVIVSDLSRSMLGWAAAWAATRMLSRSPVFHIDGPRSVRAAFQIHELRDLARQAGLAGARIVRRFPFRLLLTWTRTEEHRGAV